MEITKNKEVAQRPLSNSELVVRLKKEAATNKVFNSICYVFAMRERARHQVTASSLRLTLAREGFYFKSEDISKSLKFLSDLGIGKLEINSFGRITALKDVKIALQSIGKSAVSGNTEALKAFKPHNKFSSLIASAPITQPPTNTIKQPDTIQQRYYTIPLKTIVDGQEVVVSAHVSLTNEQVSLAIANMFEKTNKP